MPVPKPEEPRGGHRRGAATKDAITKDVVMICPTVGAFDDPAEIEAWIAEREAGISADAEGSAVREAYDRARDQARRWLTDPRYLAARAELEVLKRGARA